jgi:hypothetical protein
MLMNTSAVVRHVKYSFHAAAGYSCAVNEFAQEATQARTTVAVIAGQ